MKNIIFFSALLNIVGCFNNDYSIYETVKIEPLTGETIYLKSKKWGLTYDHQLTVISTSSYSTKWQEADTTKELVFKGLEPFVYEFKDDTLFIYCRLASFLPQNFKSNIRVIQKEVDNPVYMDLIFKVNNGSKNLKKM